MKPLAPRRAFTLVEILIVIVIIGILIALLIPTVYRAVVRAKNAAVTLEIHNLGDALEARREEFGGYPPSMCDVDDAELQNRFMAFVRRAYPRYTANSYYGDMAADPPSDGLRKAIYDLYNNPSPYDLSSLPPELGYPATTAGWGDINKLDQAECLVFWLGGMPGIPVAPFNHSTKLVGFSQDPQNPFDLTSTTRTAQKFEFDETRLKDTDGDGWWEYVPDLDVPVDPAPPYVYFDGASITARTTAPQYRAYPEAHVSVNTLHRGDPSNVALWGVAVPYGEPFGVGAKVLNAQKFQIICAGADGVYGAEGVAGLRAPIPSTGANMLDGDLDNLTNVTEGTVGDAAE